MWRPGRAREGARPRAGRVGGQLLPLDWGEISTLRLQARVIAEGIYAGEHHSTRRGAGVEFGGQRPYVPGDDLRFLDRRSLLRHDRLMVREFETDTDRVLWLCLDASASMGFRGPSAPGAKLAYAALIAAALARIATASRDPVGLMWLGGDGVREVGASAGGAAFERLIAALEAAQPGGELNDAADVVARHLRRLSQRAVRGAMVVFFSDLLDLPASAVREVASLGTRSRALAVVQILDPAERDLSFRGKVRLVSMEGRDEVVTDANVVRGDYQRRLQAHTKTWAQAVQGQGGRLVEACTTDPPVSVVRAAVRAVAEARR